MAPAITIERRDTEVGVLDHGALAQSGVAEPSAEGFVVARGCLAVEQQAEPVLAREVGGGGIVLHLDERIGHGGHAEAERRRSARGWISIDDGAPARTQ